MGVLITGATGIGAAVARRLAAGRTRIFVASLDAADCEALAAEVPDLGWTAADLADEGQAVAAIDAAVEHLGRLDGCVAVVGGSGRRHGDGPIHQIPLAGWEATLRLNLTTAFLTAREALRAMLAHEPDGERRGSLVMVSSVLATHPAGDRFATHAYAAAKGGIEALTRALAARYASDGIRVNAVAPGATATRMARRAMEDPATAAYVAGRQRLAGFVSADDVAHAAVFLLGAGSVTGEVLSVDGGWRVGG